MSSRNDRHREQPDDEREESPSRFTEQRALWVDLQIRGAMARGDFDNLPGIGKPIPDLGDTHDPDWWAKRLVEREQISGVAVLPPALAVRKDDAELESLVDRETTEPGVRRVVEDFNERVRRAMIQPLGGPPMITKQRDVDHEVAAWRARRDERRRRQRELLAREVADREQTGRRTRWWRRRR